MANQGMQSFGRLIVSRDQATRNFIGRLVNNDKEALQQTIETFDKFDKRSGDTPVFFRANCQCGDRYDLEVFDYKRCHWACDSIRKYDNDNFKKEALRELGNLYHNFKRDFDEKQAVTDMEYCSENSKEIFNRYA